MRPRPLHSAAVHHDEAITSRALRPLHSAAVHHDETVASRALRSLREE
ncbi:hypothetical protein ABZV14_29285 [Streptosporangium canum]